VTQEDRRDFPEWKVKAVYLKQDGACAKCGCSLADGFHRHHMDGDHSNNSLDNLQLLCPDCHYVTFCSEKWNAHKDVEREVLETLKKALLSATDKELSGAALERIVETAVKVLQVSRREKGLNKPMERLPELHLQYSRSDMWNWIQGYKEGFVAGVQFAKERCQRGCVEGVG